MNRLAYLIVYTPQIDRMKTFYRDRLGLPVRRDAPDRMELATSGATLVLQASPRTERRGVEFRLVVNDVEARVQELGARGVRFEGGVQRFDEGAVAGLWDSEGTMLSLMTPKRATADDDGGPRLATAIVNCRDLAGAKAFYRNVMGLHPAVETAWWVEFDTGDAHLSLHPRLPSEAREHHHSTPLTWSIEVDNLMEWVDGCRTRGVPIPTAPHDTPYGLMADVEDPDGNLFIVHEPAPEVDATDDVLDQEPRQVPVRAPGRLRSKSTSRVAVKPEHPITLVPRRRRPSANTQTVAKVRGAGRDRARLEPKTKGDEKKAKVKPATGQRAKAVGARRAVQKRATATASRGKVATRRAGKTKIAKAGARRAPAGGRGRR
jgi:catechol 2,3-dioxygenase-like lactoylglutathione lyase family enzyme